MKQFIHQFDTVITIWVQSWPSMLAPLMQLLSFIGRPVFTISTVIVVGAVALWQHNARLVIASLVAGGTFGVNSLLKLWIQRSRPDGYLSEDIILPTFSFPSGHAASSVAIFGLAAYILYHVLPQPWGLVAAIIIALAIVGIGISRVYIGAHYPSDVLVGWIVGLIGLAIIIWIVRPL